VRSIKSEMQSVFAVLIFCVILFFYLHIYFHMKTSNDLEVYEIDQPSKDKLEEVCDLRQPVYTVVLAFFSPLLSIKRPRPVLISLSSRPRLYVTHYPKKKDAVLKRPSTFLSVHKLF